MSADPALIRAIKGAPLTVLVLIALGYHGNRDISLHSGYSPNTVTSALRALEAVGLITLYARYNGWQLTSKCKQAVFPGWEPVALGESQNLRLDHPTTTDINTLPILIDSSSSSPGNRNICDSTAENDLDEYTRNLWKRLRSLGVGEPLRSQFARTLDEDDIDAVIADLKSRGKYSVPLLCHTLKSGPLQRDIEAPDLRVIWSQFDLYFKRTYSPAEYAAWLAENPEPS